MEVFGVSAEAGSALNGGMNLGAMGRREFVQGTVGAVGTMGTGLVSTAGLASLALADTPAPAMAPVKGRIQQSLCSWNFAPLTPEELAREAVVLGLKALELVGPEHFPMLSRHGLTSAIFGRHGFSKGLPTARNMPSARPPA